MSSFGENELLVISRIVGRIRVLDLSHASAVFPRLIVRLGIALHEDPKNEFSPGRPIQAFEVRDIHGELRLEEHAKVVGSLHWAGPPHFVRSSSYGAENQIELACDLDSLRIERIERHRAGREALFWLALWPSLVDAHGFLDCNIQPLRAAIPRDKWVGVLGSLTDARVTLLEVARPQLEAPEFDAAIGHLKQARTRVDHGDFDESVACCRRAIESITKALNIGHEAADLEKSLGAVSDEERGKAYAGIVSRLKGLANYAIHRSEAPGRYSRVEAQFVVGSTEHSLALLAGLLRRSVT